MVSPGLSKRDHRIAVRRGPRAVTSTRPIDVLMDAAGFRDVEVADVTRDFLAVARAWEREFDAHEDHLRGVLGGEWEERQADRRDLIAGVEAGQLQRILVTGTTRTTPS